MAAADETMVFTCERVAECPFLKGIDVAMGTRDKDSGTVMIIASKKTVQAMADQKRAYEEKEKKSLYKQKKGFKTEMKEMMARFDARFTAMDQKIQEQDQKIREQDQRIREQDKRISYLEAENAELKERVSHLEVENKALKERISALENENTGLKAEDIGLKAEIASLKARLVILEDRERHLAARAVVSVLRQLSRGPDPSAAFRWLATLSKSGEKRVLYGCLSVPPELAATFAEASQKGHDVAHSTISIQLLHQQIGLMDETERALAKELIRFMDKSEVSVFESYVTSYQPIGTPSSH